MRISWGGVEAPSFYLHVPFCRALCRFCEYTRVKSGCVGRDDDGTLRLMTDNRSVLRSAVEVASFPWSEEEGEEEYFDGIAHFMVPESTLKDGGLAVVPKDGAVDVWDLPEQEYDPVNCRWDPFD